MVIFKFMAISRAWVGEASGAAVLVADGILVDRGIGLRCAIVGRGDAITGFTAIITVPVVHGTIWILIYAEKHRKTRKKSIICISTICYGVQKQEKKGSLIFLGNDKGAP